MLSTSLPGAGLTNRAASCSLAPDGEPLRLAALRVETGLKLPDCCALDAALTSDSTLATFDDRLAQAGAGWRRLAQAARTRHLSVGPLSV